MVSLLIDLENNILPSLEDLIPALDFISVPDYAPLRFAPFVTENRLELECGLPGEGGNYY